MHLDIVPFYSHHALDERIVLSVLRAIDAFEDDDVAPLWLCEAVDELVGDNPVANFESWDHALRRDAESLKDKRSYEAKDQRDRDEDRDE